MEFVFQPKLNKIKFTHGDLEEINNLMIILIISNLYFTHPLLFPSNSFPNVSHVYGKLLRFYYYFLKYLEEGLLYSTAISENLKWLTVRTKRELAGETYNTHF